MYVITSVYRANDSISTRPRIRAKRMPACAQMALTVANTRRASELATRYGGEEFAVLLPGHNADEAFVRAEAIRESILTLRAEQQGRPDSTPTVSIGVAAMVPRQGLQPRDLIKAADIALYRAKSNGRNRAEAAPETAPVLSRRAA